MRDNFFKTPLHQDSDGTDYHDDAFQMMDTDSRNTERGWPGDKSRNPQDYRDNLDMDREMSNTLNQMGGQVDNSTCGCSSKPSKEGTNKSNANRRNVDETDLNNLNSQSNDNNTEAPRQSDDDFNRPQTLVYEEIYIEMSDPQSFVDAESDIIGEVNE